MQTRVYHLRQLFESHVAEFTRILGQDPPEVIGSVDATMRGLKAFLFAFEGLVRKDNLRSVPFTSRQQLAAQVEYAIQQLEALSGSPNAQQVVEALQPVDALHGLCMQAGLMAGDLDANRMRQVALGLNRSLGDAIGEIDAVAEKARGHVEAIDGAGQQHLAELAERYDEAARGLAAEAEAIRQRQQEAAEKLAQLDDALAHDRDAHERQLKEQAAAAEQLLTEARRQHEGVESLLAETRQQLDAARGTTADIERLKGEIESVERDWRGRLDAAEQTSREHERQLSEHEQRSARASQQADESSSAADQARRRIEELETSLSEQLERARARHEQVSGALDDAGRALDELRQRFESVMQEQSAAARRVVEELGTERDTAETARREAESHQHAAAEQLEHVRRVRQEADNAAETLRHEREQAQRATAALREHLASGGQALERVVQARDDATEHVEAMRRQREQMDEAQRQTEGAIEQLREQAEQRLGAHEQRVAEMVERNRQIQHQLDEMFGQLTDGGLSQPYDAIARDLARHRWRWLGLTIGAAVGAALLTGAVLPLLAGTVGAGVTIVLALLASLPLWFLAGFCAVQYVRERGLEADYEHRRAVVRGLGPYRRLLAELRQQGLEESPLMQRLTADILREPGETHQRTGEANPLNATSSTAPPADAGDVGDVGKDHHEASRQSSSTPV